MKKRIFLLTTMLMFVSALFAQPEKVSVSAINCELKEMVAGAYFTQNGPTSNNYEYCYTQQIYDAGEIGYTGQNKIITKLAYQCTLTTPWTEPYTIYMGNTTKSVFEGNAPATFIPISQMQLVYDGTLSFSNANSWSEFELTTPFEYTGGNIVVAAVCNSGHFESGTKWLGGFHPTYAQKLVHAYSHDAPVDPENLTAPTTTIIPDLIRSNIRFEVCDPIVAPEPCNPPTDLNVVYTTDCKANLTWTAPIGKGNTSKAVVYSEGFETTPINSLPTGWSQWDLVYDGWSVDDSYWYPHAGNQFVIYFWDAYNGDANAWLRTSGISLTSGVTYNISFYVQAGYNDDDGNDFEVKIGTSPTLPMTGGTTIYQANNLYSGWHDASTPEEYYILVEILYTPPTTGTYYLAFHEMTPDGSGYNVIIDDLLITTYDAPLPTTYNVYREDVKINTAPVTTNSYTDATLNVALGHTWEVKKICVDDEESDAASKTMPVCDPPNPPEPCSPVENLEAVYVSDPYGHHCKAQLTWEAPSTDCDDVIIGTATTAGYLLPVSTYFNYSYVQHLYTAADLAGRENNEITAIAFEYIYAQENPKDNVTIYMGHTTKTEFNSDADWIPLSQLTAVYSGSIVFNNNNTWFNIEFNEPFFYEGGSLVVAVLNNHGSFSTGNNPTFRYHGAPDVQTLYYISEGATPINPAVPPMGYTTFNRSNTRFIMCPTPGKYTIYRDGDEIISNYKTRSYLDVGFDSYEPHSWDVVLVCNDGGVAPAESVSLDPCQEAGNCDAPDHLTVTYEFDCTATLDWGAAGWYNIYRDGEQIAFEHSGSTYTDYLLNPYVEHTWCVAPICPNGWEPLDPVCATMPHCAPPPCDVTVGNGTGTTYQIPANTSYNYSYTQQIYDASELNLAAGTEIKGIAFQYFYATPNPKNPLTIYLGNTTKKIFTNNFDWVPVYQMTQVFNQQAVTFNNSTQWYAITFDTPFVYDGTSNIVVAVLNNDGDNITDDNPTFYTHAALNKALHSCINGSTPISLSPPPAASEILAERNNVRFLICNLDHDLEAVSITGNCHPAENVPYAYIVNITNKGIHTESDYSVQVRTSDNVVLGTTTAVPVIAPGETLPVVVTPVTFLAPGETCIKGSVILAADQYPVNNSTPQPYNCLDVRPYSEEDIVDIPCDPWVGTKEFQIPFNFYYLTSMVQSIYLQSEINVPDGFIHSISWFYNATQYMTDKPVKIWLANANINSLSSGWYPEANFTLVYEGKITVLSEKPCKVTVQIPEDKWFLYTGGNLVVMTERVMDFEWKNYVYSLVTPASNRTREYHSETEPFNWTQEGDIVNSVANLELQLKRVHYYAVSGFVQGSDQSYIQGATVKLEGYDNYSMLTGSNGEFSFEDVFGAAGYKLTVTATGWEQHESTWDIYENTNMGTIILTKTVTISDYDNDNYLIYPNPAHNIIYIERGSDILATIEIYNAMGMHINSYETGEAKFQINVADLAAGTYFIRIIEGTKVTVKSIVISTF